MAPSVIPILIAGMLATGVANSIFSKVSCGAPLCICEYCGWHADPPLATRARTLTVAGHAMRRTLWSQ